jgi:hypothetical protein
VSRWAVSTGRRRTPTRPASLRLLFSVLLSTSRRVFFTSRACRARRRRSISVLDSAAAAGQSKHWSRSELAETGQNRSEFLLENRGGMRYRGGSVCAGAHTLTRSTRPLACARTGPREHARRRARARTYAGKQVRTRTHARAHQCQRKVEHASTHACARAQTQARAQDRDRARALLRPHRHTKRAPARARPHARPTSARARRGTRRSRMAWGGHDAQRSLRECVGDVCAPGPDSTQRPAAGPVVITQKSRSKRPRL